MNKFKDKLRLQIWINCIGIVILLVFQVLAFARVISPFVGNEHWADLWNGFIAGAAMGIMALLIIGVIMNIRALRNEKALKKLFVKENDEREQSLYTAARSAGAQVFLIGGLVAGITAGFFNVSVCITIITCVFLHSVICAGFKFYYSRKY